MYFPFLRGKQFDLIALKEASTTIIEKSNVMPIIEPVNAKNYVKSSLNKFVEVNMPFMLITNPQVGELSKEEVKSKIIEDIIDEYDNYIPSFIISSTTTLKEINDFLEEYSNNEVGFIHFHSFQNVNNLVTKFNEYENIKYQVFFDGKLSFDYISRFDKTNKVILKDEFNRQHRNADYVEEEFYSDTYKRYKSLGFTGFGDFSIIGDYFMSGSGGAAHAIAIHYTYVNDNDNNNIWVKHFLSDDKDGPENPAGKFAEAVQKCALFLEQNNPKCEKCSGCKDFMHFHNNGHYPGLGTVKKVSLKHHIELMSKLI